mgnify:FL=1|tara:strand:+ start:327 stop:1286 length:960 start_codon:yes stop_codon:yes gene_type:complete
MSHNQVQTISWIVFFTIMAFISYYFVLVATNISNDFPEYTALADRLRGEPLSYSFERELTEPFYLILFWVLSNVFTSKAVVIIAGIIPLIFKSIIIKRFSYYPFIGLIFYFGTFLPLHDANQIRLAGACMFILYALMLREDISKTKLIFLSVAATAFHYTGILLLILLFKNRKYLALTLMTIGSFLFVPIFEYIETINESFKIFNRYTAETASIGFTSPYFLLHFVAAVSSLLIWKSLNHIQQKGALFLAMGALAFILFQSLDILAIRIRELGYLGIIPLLFSSKIRLTIPWIVIISSSLLMFLLFTYEVWKELLSYMV